MIAASFFFPPISAGVFFHDLFLRSPSKATVNTAHPTCPYLPSCSCRFFLPRSAVSPLAIPEVRRRGVDCAPRHTPPRHGPLKSGSQSKAVALFSLLTSSVSTKRVHDMFRSKILLSIARDSLGISLPPEFPWFPPRIPLSRWAPPSPASPPRPPKKLSIFCTATTPPHYLPLVSGNPRVPRMTRSGAGGSSVQNTPFAKHPYAASHNCFFPCLTEVLFTLLLHYPNAKISVLLFPPLPLAGVVTLSGRRPQIITQLYFASLGFRPLAHDWLDSSLENPTGEGIPPFMLSFPGRFTHRHPGGLLHPLVFVRKGRTFPICPE